MISGAFKIPSQIVSFPPTFIPKPFTLANFTAVWQSIPLLRYFWNSLFIAVVSTIGTVACSSLVAFGFARIRARGKNIWFILLLSTMMVPYYVTIIPTFSLYEKLGWLNTYLPLTVPSFLGVGALFTFSCSGSSFSAFLMNWMRRRRSMELISSTFSGTLCSHSPNPHW
jgi:multiple sugar transport system permease protein